MAFLGSMFGGVMGGLEKGYKFGGEIVKDLRLNELLKQTAQTPGEVGSGGGESTGTTTPSAGAGTPYSAGGDKPTPGAPYVQEKPAPPPPPMKPFETIKPDASRGGPPPGMGSALPTDPYGPQPGDNPQGLPETPLEIWQRLQSRLGAAATYATGQEAIPTGPTPSQSRPQVSARPQPQPGFMSRLGAALGMGGAPTYFAPSTVNAPPPAPPPVYGPNQPPTVTPSVMP